MRHWSSYWAEHGNADVSFSLLPRVNTIQSLWSVVRVVVIMIGNPTKYNEEREVPQRKQCVSMCIKSHWAGGGGGGSVC